MDFLLTNLPEICQKFVESSSSPLDILGSNLLSLLVRYVDLLASKHWIKLQ